MFLKGGWISRIISVQMTLTCLPSLEEALFQVSFLDETDALCQTWVGRGLVRMSLLSRFTLAPPSRQIPSTGLQKVDADPPLMEFHPLVPCLLMKYLPAVSIWQGKGDSNIALLSWSSKELAHLVTMWIHNQLPNLWKLEQPGFMPVKTSDSILDFV